MSDNVEDLWLIGTGYMAEEYTKVLDSMGVKYRVIGNTRISVEHFREKMGIEAYCGGVKQYIKEHCGSVPEYAINAVDCLKLYEITRELILAGVKKILVEKPGSVSLDEFCKLKELADVHRAEVYIAYNRRFYSSVIKAKEIIAADGGVRSACFEFTEWRHVIEKTSHPDVIKQKQFLMNSSHVVDLVFHLIGKPRELNSVVKGENCIDWHQVGSIYAGSGITNNDIPFSYHANWDAPGRWGVELLTKHHRLFFRPLEKLQIQENGSVNIVDCILDDKFDCKYKPGLFKEVEAFINEKEKKVLCTLSEQIKCLNYYRVISGEEY